MEERLKLTEKQTEIFYKIKILWDQLDKNNIAFGVYNRNLGYEADMDTIVFFNKEYVEDFIVQDYEEPVPEGWIEVNPDEMEYIDFSEDYFYNL